MWAGQWVVVVFVWVGRVVLGLDGLGIGWVEVGVGCVGLGWVMGRGVGWHGQVGEAWLGEVMWGGAT